MTATTQQAQEATTQAQELRRDILRRMIQVSLTMLLWGALLFGAAGTLGWRRGWLCMGAYALSLLLNLIIVGKLNPQIIAERGKKHEGTKAFDKIFGVIFGILLLAVPITAGLDAARFGWSTIPFVAFVPGFVLFALGSIPITWSMVANRHLETTVRIQKERDHQVVTTGPYAIVRHPMYIGMILQYLGLPLMVGSAWAYLPSLGAIVAMVIRTRLEDDTLQDELPGYKAFTKQTKYRLLPGVW